MNLTTVESEENGTEEDITDSELQGETIFMLINTSSMYPEIGVVFI